jgi:hypothetical protein
MIILFWGDASREPVASGPHLGRHPFPFLRYGHYIRHISDRQSRQQLGIIFRQQQSITADNETVVVQKEFYKVDNSFRTKGLGEDRNMLYAQAGGAGALE